MDEIAEVLIAKPARMLRSTLLALTALLAGVFTWSWATRVDLVVRAKGRVVASGTPLVASVGGRVMEVRATEGMDVAKGEVLVRLDPAPFEEEIRRAKLQLQGEEAELARAERVLRALDEQEAAALEEAARIVSREEARRTKTASETRLAELEVEAGRGARDRARRQVADGLEPSRVLLDAEEALQRLEAKLEVARALEKAAEGELRVAESRPVRKEFEARRQEVRRDPSRAEALRETLRGLERDLEGCTLRAPSAGIVTQRPPKVGEFLEAHRPVLVLAPFGDLEIEAAVPSVEDVAVGMKSRVRYEDRTIDGTVTFVSPDAVDGRYVIRVRPDQAIKLGTAADVEIVTGRSRLAALFGKKVRREIALP